MASDRPDSHLHGLLDGNIGEDAADAVVDLVALDLLADFFELVEERLQDAAFTWVEGATRFRMMTGSCLTIAVDAAHALFQAGRFQGTS